MKEENGSFFGSNIKSLEDIFFIAAEKIENFVDKNLRLELDDIVANSSDSLDQVILKQEKENQLSYIGGKFKILYQSEAYFRLAFELYFKNLNDEWVQVTAGSPDLEARALKQEALEELRNKQEIVFEVDAPQK